MSLLSTHMYAFYKGISMPYPKDAFKHILNKMKTQKQLLDSQSTDYFLNELNEMEQDLRQEVKNDTLNIFDVSKVAKKHEIDLQDFIGLWVLYIAVLLDRKVIKNDNMNGWLGMIKTDKIAIFRI